MDDVVDGGVGESLGAEGFDVLLAHLPGGLGELGGEVQGGPIFGAEVRLAVVGLDGLDEGIRRGGCRLGSSIETNGDLGTEVLGVLVRSVMARVELGDDRGNHLPPGSG